MAQASQIVQLIGRFSRSLEGLGLQPSQAQIERWAVLVHRSMNLGRRRFHTAAHVLAVTIELPPLASLAGLFHDIVYVQVDDGFPESVADRLSQIALHVPGAPTWELTPVAGDGLPGLCAELFGVKPGDQLGPFTGINEYLSAVVAVEALEELLDRQTLAMVAACIEATIPFRGYDDQGRSPFEVLEARLRGLSTPLGDVDLEDCMRQALRLANRDVVNFADEQPARFLTNTWALLPETNRPLTGFGVYSIIEYRQSLQRMERFLRHLDPATIFHRRGSQPPAERYALLRELARRNVGIARRYLGIKLFTMGLIEAFALLTGGDAPIALFMGDASIDDLDMLRAEDLLPARDPGDGPRDDVIADLLHIGRASPSHFDLQNSPLSSYLYLALGEERLLAGLEQAELMFAGDLPPRALLDLLDEGLRADLARAFAELVPTRREALLALC